MKKALIVILGAVMLLSSAYASELMGSRQERIYESVKYCMDVPKDAQIINAMEYACNPGRQIHMLLIHVTQHSDIEQAFGSAT